MSRRMLLDLDEESWGHRLRRAREASPLTLEEAANRVSRVVPCSAPTLHRLERLDEAPTEWRRMVLAWLAVVAYGYKPAALDLPENPFPVTMRDFDAIPDILGDPVSEAPLRPHESPARPDSRSPFRRSGWSDGTAGQSHYSKAA